MAFTVEDYHDLVGLLADHPEWKEELRHLLLSDELLALPEIVRELAAAQKRTEVRLDALTETVSELTDAVSELRGAVSELTGTVGGLQDKTDGLQDRTGKLEDTVGRLKGYTMELIYRSRAGSYFGRRLSHIKIVELHTLVDALGSALTPKEFDELLLLDLLVTGKVRDAPGSPDVWLAMEVSSVVDRNDVERAVRRADLLRRTGYRVVPVAAGEGVTQGGEQVAREQNVVLMRNGRIDLWDEAWSAWGNMEGTHNQ